MIVLLSFQLKVLRLRWTLRWVYRLKRTTCFGDSSTKLKPWQQKFCLIFLLIHRISCFKFHGNLHLGQKQLSFSWSPPFTQRVTNTPDMIYCCGRLWNSKFHFFRLLSQLINDVIKFCNNNFSSNQDKQTFFRLRRLPRLPDEEKHFIALWGG